MNYKPEFDYDEIIKFIRSNNSIKELSALLDGVSANGIAMIIDEYDKIDKLIVCLKFAYLKKFIDIIGNTQNNK